MFRITIFGRSFKSFELLAYLMLSFFICVIGLIRPGFTICRGELHSMVDGTQMQPFVRRALVPFMIRGLEAVVPASVKEKVASGVVSSMPFAVTFFKSKEEVFRKSSAVLIIWLSLFGFTVFIRLLFMTIYRGSDMIAALFPLLVLTILPLHFFRAFMLYDIPSLFLSTVCLYFCSTEKWKWYYPCFLFAAVNREASIFLITVFLFLHYKKYPTGKLLLHLFAQGCIWTAVFVWLLLRFKNNPGEVFESTFVSNILVWQVNFGLIGTLQIIGYGYLLYIAFRKWKKKPEALKKMFYGLSPLFLVSLLVGAVEELRVYYEIFPVLILLAFHNMTDEAPEPTESVELVH